MQVWISLHLCSRRGAGPSKGGESSWRSGRGFHICHECVSRAFQLGKETSTGDRSQSLNRPWQQGKGKQSQTDHCPSQLETSHPASLSSTSFEQKGVFLSTMSSNHFVSWSWSLVSNPVILKSSHSRTQHSISEDSCGTVQEWHSGLSSSSYNRLLSLDKNSQGNIST